ncbi:hypothetical protein [Nostoc sp. ATCC 53789]|jgi:hypothetical protein|uniref:hypothetical protein n=1 Tax=Nostoc sp. ATCC 53789 TaxID=76335 RepID=UPI000DED1058|nr:hypothetical protein [Nostoc sp. ATCC 53789]MBD2509984.1 hypothetical protein [Desmonostoc muscorum FACHB-395]QHG15463.1 hypothetical protein GJB62_05425 [Nostoc sp. ATCC 53789]RCJ16396.1 hypothetical protein A6V25_08610 [Nostoc sp. ATCC 53789]
MKTISSLDAVTKHLEQHENSKRIKKLIYSACKNIWENDEETLDRFKLQELIQELFRLNPTTNNLNYSLSEVVKTLNKQAEYAIIANVIFHQMQKLYITPEEPTGIFLNKPHQEESTGIFLNQQEPISLNSIDKSPNSQIKYQYNQFDLRQNIMKYTNPLRAKIVLFSALDKKFTFNEEDWLKLKTQKLDDLLLKLFNICPTLRELESKLNSAVISLGKPDENIQAASAIIQSMRALYGDISPSAGYNPFNNDPSPETKTPVNPYQKIGLNDDGNTCQFIAPPPK